MLIVDLSSNNQEPNFPLLKRSGVDGVWLKATEGMSWRDPTFQRRREAANRAGLRVGAYAFARPDLHPLDPQGEAHNFVQTVKSIGRTDLRPALDYEVRSEIKNDEGWVAAWNQVVKSRLNVGPVLYSYYGLLQELKFSKPRGYGLWLASYGRDDGVEHPFQVPAPWRKIAAHQFSSKCRVAGVPGLVDLSKVYQPNVVLAFPVRGRF